MRSCHLLTCLAFVSIVACDTASSVEDPDVSYFIKYFGSDGDQYGVDMVSLPDGTFMLLGNQLKSSVESKIYLLRVDGKGEVIWQRTFADGLMTAKDIEPTNDGNFIILADYQAGIGAKTDGKLLKVSGDGVALDSTYFGVSDANDFSSTITSVSDGSFIVSGTTDFTATFNQANNPDPDLGDFFNYRFDSALDQMTLNDWAPISPGFGGKLDVAVKTIEHNNQFYVFGHSNIELTDQNPNKKMGLLYFLRGQDGGESNNFYPGNVFNSNDTRIQYVADVAPQLGQGLIVVGTSVSNLGVSEIFVARMRKPLTFQDLDNDAILYTTIHQGKNIEGVSAASSVNGESGFLIVGNEVRSTSATNFWLTKIDQSGQVLWSTTFGSELENDMAAAVAELPDGKIVVLGTIGLADNQFKMAFMKLNRRGEFLK